MALPSYHSLSSPSLFLWSLPLPLHGRSEWEKELNESSTGVLLDVDLNEGHWCIHAVPQTSVLASKVSTSRGYLHVHMHTYMCTYIYTRTCTMYISERFILCFVLETTLSSPYLHVHVHNKTQGKNVNISTVQYCYGAVLLPMQYC